MALIRKPLQVQPSSIPGMQASNTPLQYGSKPQSQGVSLAQILGGQQQPNRSMTPPPSFRPQPQTGGGFQMNNDRMPQDFGVETGQAAGGMPPQTGGPLRIPSTGGPLRIPSTGGGLQIPNQYIPYGGNREDIRRR